MNGNKQFDKSELQIIRSIQLQDNPTRQSISKEVGLSLQKVSKVLLHLEKIGTIKKNGKQLPTNGRPSFIYRLNTEEMYVIGASIDDIGMTMVALDATNVIINTKELRFSEEALCSIDSTQLIEEIVGGLKSMKEDLKAIGARPSAIGVSVPGMIDTARRLWLSGLQLPGISHIDLDKEICKRINIPVYAEDNSRITSYYEMIRGKGKGIENFAVLYLGLGVGAGIIINNEIYRGANGTAGEIGHIIHPSNNYRCSCGNVGCLETITSETGIIRVFQDRLAEGVHSMLSHNEQPLSLKLILDAAEAGDRLARTTLFEIGEFIGDACTYLIYLFNPQKVIITGPVAIFEKYLQEAITLSLSRKIFPNIYKNTQLEFTQYSVINEANGAALYALSQFWGGKLGKEA